ncbi:MAG: Re/Si-specific NAD(P)(+) transhydrogenase subunit alpha [Mariprofundaceae bacterium]|nr:Re/Si-specific NAD(P)(+) transhydrogenase subunit alpha [Mariprofundaceae bacterium]
MRIAIPLEIIANEHRVAATPETVKKYIATGFDVVLQSGAGEQARFNDAAYVEAGATLESEASALFAQADILLKVRAPEDHELAHIPTDCLVIALLDPFTNPLLAAYAKKGLRCVAMEKIPRISRAQSMDVLSSQANIAGYKSVLVAAEYYRSFFPMLMTAAGTVQPARVLIMGAGVAGLQAIATARRLGAIVDVFDVRAAAKEQVESLGANFVEVENAADAEDSGGYAKEMSEEYKKKQALLIEKSVAKADVVITTALIPGRPAPLLITEDMVKSMKAGSVIVDMAVASGGNCALSGDDGVWIEHEVTIVGLSNLPSLMATDSSRLYARNLLNFMQLIAKDGEVVLAEDDEIIQASLICANGQLLTEEKSS